MRAGLTPSWRRSGVAVTAAAGLLVGVVAAGPAGAQTCDPVYGCGTSTTSTTTGPSASCDLDVDIVAAGELHDASVTNAPPNAPADITLDGDVVGTGTTNPNGDAVIAFTVPAGTTEGQHAVFAVGSSFSASCGTVASTAVLGESLKQVPEGGIPAEGVGGSGGASGGSLARTGMDIGLVVALALVLIVSGHRIVQRAGRRRRRPSAVPPTRRRSPCAADHGVPTADR